MPTPLTTSDLTDPRTVSATHHACDTGTHSCDQTTNHGVCVRLIRPPDGHRCGCADGHRCSDGDCNTVGHACVRETARPTASPPTADTGGSKTGSSNDAARSEILVVVCVAVALLLLLLLVLLLRHRRPTNRADLPDWQQRLQSLTLTADPLFDDLGPAHEPAKAAHEDDIRNSSSTCTSDPSTLSGSTLWQAMPPTNQLLHVHRHHRSQIKRVFVTGQEGTQRWI